MKTEMTNLLRKKGRLKQDLRSSSRGNVAYAERSVIKEQIVGHWTLTRIKGLLDTTTKINKNYKFNGNCNYCHKKGHKEADCRAKQRDNANNVEEEKTNVEEWIGDTGATCHMKSNMNGMS